MDKLPSELRINRAWVTCIGLLCVCVCALGLRISLFKFESADYTYFLQPWYEHIQQFGFHAFKDNFSNYNLPYLYLLFLAKLVHLPALLAIKLISTVFDGLLAYGVYLVIRYYRNNQYLALSAALTALFLPTVFLNSSAWGQSDSIYTSFLIFSFYAVLKRKPTLAWTFWAIAFCFKLQAIFFLPFLAYIWLSCRNGKWWLPFISVPIFFIPFVPALVAGRSFSSILLIYKSQATTTNVLTWNAPNLYQWFGGVQGHYFNQAGIFIALGAGLALVLAAVVFVHRSLDERSLLALVALGLFLIPFLLPQMHDRYFYPAEIFSFMLPFVITRYALLAISVELVGFFSYSLFLFQKDAPLTMGWLAIIQFINICVLIYLLFISSQFYGLPKSKLKKVK